MNVLITSVSRHVSLVKAFREALKKEGGGKVIAVDVSPLASALYFADEHYLVPPSKDSLFLETIFNLCQQLAVQLLISARDEELLLFSNNKDKFAKIGTTIMVPTPMTINICQDKKHFLKFCNENDFCTPANYPQTDSIVEEDFPLFVKPRFGKGGKCTFIVRSKQELKTVLEHVIDPIIQEFVNAPEYTIDLFADFKGRIISVIPRERIAIFGGESYIAKTHNDPVLIKEAIRLAQKLKLIGHNTIQCFLDKGEVKFIEVNPRFGGASSLGFAAGAPTPHFLIKLLKGKKVDPQIGLFKDQYMMLRYTQDLFLDSNSITDRKFK